MTAAIGLPDAPATEALGAALARRIGPGDIVTLSGPLGAGKTTLARGLLRGLGFPGEVASPTFPLVITYEPPAVLLPLWHVDLYRLDDAEEIAELGLDDALSDGALLVEWPDRLPAHMRRSALSLDITVVEAGERALTATVPPAWEGRWPPA